MSLVTTSGGGSQKSFFRRDQEYTQPIGGEETNFIQPWGTGTFVHWATGQIVLCNSFRFGENTMYPSFHQSLPGSLVFLVSYHLILLGFFLKLL